jgi:hypothetical protein
MNQGQDCGLVASKIMIKQSEKVSLVHDLRWKITLFAISCLNHHAPHLEGKYIIEIAYLGIINKEEAK